MSPSSRCFPLPADSPIIAVSQGEHDINRWFRQFAPTRLSFTDEQALSLAQLMPLLLCGEQSAQLVFSQHAQLLPANSQSQRALLLVERDESRHDQALEWVLQQLPASSQQHRSQRLSQRFYARLGRSQTTAEQFINIAALDACVTQVMRAMSVSTLGRNHPFSQLCQLIMRDEAKHVYVSRQYAAENGASFAQMHQRAVTISNSLFELLSSQHRAFEHLGVDLDNLERKLVSKWQ
ncbi:hypothetical protein [Paraferrimonas haliotis]|uniref:Ferritin-like domain-containing protein n=1 Tax=Paraferrimonas haliotis TaxID=2013866 RepID=A0AA37WYN9_9GAMM|nr:hypothetical protein [Paraferrimonas haliotis]GLS84035.1 hypothetical protein GCM10007894_20120 [Paraferrimonas haliotis]